MEFKGLVVAGKSSARFVVGDTDAFKAAAAEAGCLTKFSLKGGNVVLDISAKYMSMPGIALLTMNFESGRVKTVSIVPVEATPIAPVPVETKEAE